jgi:uncharacterized protein YjiS (DUF1127 family)
MYQFAGEGGIDLDTLRRRLRRMDDEALKGFGDSCAFLGRPYENESARLPPPETFVVQLREAGEEWRRRHAGDHLGARPLHRPGGNHV